MDSMDSSVCGMCASMSALKYSTNHTREIVREFILNATLHVGEYKASARSADFNGWLLCDGRSLVRSAYPDLFDAIGTAFGSADGLSFNIPDLRGRVMGVVGHGAGLTDRALGAACGEESHALAVSEVPGHTHEGTTGTGGAHTHTTNAVGGSVGLAVADGTNTVVNTDPSVGELDVWTTPAALSIDAAAAHTHAFTTGSTGGGLAHNTMQPTLFAGNVFVLASFVR